jgi:hypothetical protein
MRIPHMLAIIDGLEAMPVNDVRGDNRGKALTK